MKFTVRNEESLNGPWQFQLGDHARGFYKGLEDQTWRTVIVPHDWSVEHPFSEEHSSGTGYLPGGIGWYRKHFFLPDELEGRRVSITFDGVYNNCSVWCNSNYLGKRPYGYSSVCYDITEFVVPGENVVAVRVAHEDTADSRWFTGSGIYRDVTLTITGESCFERHGIFVRTEALAAAQAVISVDWQAVAAEGARVRLSVYNGEQDEITQELCKGAVGTQKLTIPCPAYWSPETPSLYTIWAELLEGDRVVDVVKTSFGIRSIRFDASSGFYLNEKNTKLKGVCLHHDAGVLGAAVPKDVWRRRLQKLKDMGCNAIRMSHNPPDPKLLDLCDTMGFLAMDEAFDEWEGCKNKWWQGHNVYPPKLYGYSEHFPQWHEADLTEMVRRDRNHPSIIAWSIGNEIDYPNDPYCHPYFTTMTGNNDSNKPAAEREYDPNKPNAKRLATIARNLTKIVKKHDTTRPVTAAIAFPELSNTTGYCDQIDIVGYNYKEHLYEQDHANYPNRVLYGSENARSLEQWTAVRDNDYICGQFIWTGIDYMGEAKGWPIRVAEPGCLNMAGFEKPLYYQRQAVWSGCPVLRLATHAELGINGDNLKTKLNEVFHWNYSNKQVVEVACYTNCDNVELFLNGNSLGSVDITPSMLGRASWQVEYLPGELLAKGWKAGEQHTCMLATAGQPASFKVCPYLGVDKHIVQLEISLVDGEGIAVAQQECDVGCTAMGAVLLGSESGAPDDLTPYTSATRKTHGGKLIVYLRKDSNESAKLVISANGCQDCIVEV